MYKKREGGKRLERAGSLEQVPNESHLHKLSVPTAGEGENEKRITLGDGSVVFQCPTPTPTFSSEQVEELNDWIKGGEAEEGKYCLVKSLQRLVKSAKLLLVICLHV